MFPNDIIEMLESDESDKEDVNGENCESVEENFWTDILESLDTFRLCFASIVMLNKFALN